METVVVVIGFIVTLIVLVIIVRLHGVFFLRTVKKLEKMKSDGELTEKIYLRYANIYSGLKRENMVLHFFEEKENPPDHSSDQAGKNQNT